MASCLLSSYLVGSLTALLLKSHPQLHLDSITMSPTVYTPAPVAVNHTSSSPIFFTPLTIVVFVLMIIFIIILLGSMAVFSYRRYIRSNQSSLALADDTVDLQANDTAHSYVDYTDDKLSLWTAFCHWFLPPTEPELPWHVYAVVPATRPKGPIYIRVFKALMFWKKDEYKVGLN